MDSLFIRSRQPQVQQNIPMRDLPEPDDFKLPDDPEAQDRRFPVSEVAILPFEFFKPRVYTRKVILAHILTATAALAVGLGVAMVVCRATEFGCEAGYLSKPGDDAKASVSNGVTMTRTNTHVSTTHTSSYRSTSRFSSSSISSSRTSSGSSSRSSLSSSSSTTSHNVTATVTSTSIKTTVTTKTVKPKLPKPPKPTQSPDINKCSDLLLKICNLEVDKKHPTPSTTDKIFGDCASMFSMIACSPYARLDLTSAENVFNLDLCPGMRPFCEVADASLAVTATKTK